MTLTKKNVTWCVSHVFCVSKSDGHGNTEDHENPIDLRNINLAMYLVRSVNDLDSWEATKWLALVNDRKCSADDRLASHYRSKNRYYKHRPPYTFCIPKILMHQSPNRSIPEEWDINNFDISLGYHIYRTCATLIDSNNVFAWKVQICHIPGTVM